MAVFIQRVSNKKIAASIIIGLIISCVGLPGLSFSTAPDVLALIIFYWAMLGGDNRPRLGTVFLLGLIVDFLGGQIIGLHALKYLFLVAVAEKFDNRFRMSARLNRVAFVIATFVALEAILYGLVASYVGAFMDINQLVMVAAWCITWPFLEFIIEKNYARVDK